MAPVQQLIEAELPACLFEIGTLMHGLPAFSCPRCQLFYNSVDVVTPQCVHCGLKPRVLTAAEMADILIPPRVVDSVLEAARAQRLGEVPAERLLAPGEEFADENRADDATIAARRARTNHILGRIPKNYINPPPPINLDNPGEPVNMD